MFNEPMPINPFTGLTALGFTRRGPIWPVLGGAPDENGGGGGGGENNNGGGGNGGGANNNGGGSGGGGNNNGGGGNSGAGSNNNNGGGGNGAAGSNNGGNSSDEPKSYTTAQLNAMFEDRVARDRKARGVEDFETYKKSHEELTQLKEKDLPEADRMRNQLAERDATNATLTTERDDAVLTALRFTVAAEKNVPLTSAPRLQGKTREELEADADKFLAETGVLGGAAGGNGRPLPNFQQGGGGTPTGGSTAAGRELYKSKHGNTK